MLAIIPSRNNQVHEQDQDIAMKMSLRNVGRRKQQPKAMDMDISSHIHQKAIVPSTLRRKKILKKSLMQGVLVEEDDLSNTDTDTDSISSDSSPKSPLTFPATKQANIARILCISREVCNDDMDEEVPELQQERSRRRAGRVIFDELVQVREVSRICDIGEPSERSKFWFQENEYKLITTRAKRIAQNYGRCDDEDINNERYCLRGLERFIESTRRIGMKCDGWDAVLDEQEYQIDQGIYPLDQERIAMAYRPFSIINQRDAIDRARQDAEDVKLYCKQSSSTTLPSQPQRQLSVPTDLR